LSQKHEVGRWRPLRSQLARDLVSAAQEFEESLEIPAPIVDRSGELKPIRFRRPSSPKLSEER